MKSYIEHANITVRDTDVMIEFIQTALPDFQIRKRWEIDGFEWTHLGTDASYFALMHPLNIPEKNMDLYQHDTSATGVNHLCVVVSDVEGVRERLLHAGYQRGFNNGDLIDTEVRRSVYFHDPDGREFEFMEYLTEDIEKRNSYEI